MERSDWNQLLDLLGAASEDPDMPGDLRDAIGEIRDWIHVEKDPT